MDRSNWDSGLQGNLSLRDDPAALLNSITKTLRDAIERHAEGIGEILSISSIGSAKADLPAYTRFLAPTL
jgi:hypothetical protein